MFSSEQHDASSDCERWRSPFTIPIGMCGIKERENILWRHTGLNIVNCGTDQAAPRSQSRHVRLHFASNVFRRAESQRLLAIRGTTPEHDFVAICLFQLDRVHPFGIDLNWIQNIDAHLNQRGDQVEDSSV